MSLTAAIQNIQIAMLADSNIDTVSWAVSKDIQVLSGQVLVLGTYAVLGDDITDSNRAHEEVEFFFVVAKKLTSASLATEGIYIATEMPLIQRVLGDPHFFEVTGVREARERPALSRAERDGNVVEFTVEVTVTLTP